MPKLLIDYDKAALKEITDAIDAVGQGTQRAAMEAALTASAEVLADVKAAAPVREGVLRAGLVLNRERSRKKAKQAYDIWPTPRLNYHFRKQVIHPGPGKRDTAYYPASQNYGYDAPYGRGPRRKGKFFMEGTMQKDSARARETILREIERKIDEAWGG